MRETWRNQPAACASVTCWPGRGPQHAAGLDRVGRDEREQLGDGPEVVVDQTGSHHGRAPGGSAPVAVGRVGVPAPERRGLLGRGRRVAQDVAGAVEGRQPAVEAQQTRQPLLADGRPAQRAGLQHGAQMPLDRLAQPGLGDLARGAPVVGLRLARRQRDPGVAARVPVVQGPPRAVVAAGEQGQAGEAEHDPQPGAAGNCTLGLS